MRRQCKGYWGESEIRVPSSNHRYHTVKLHNRKTIMKSESNHINLQCSKVVYRNGQYPSHKLNIGNFHVFVQGRQSVGKWRLFKLYYCYISRKCKMFDVTCRSPMWLFSFSLPFVRYIVEKLYILVVDTNLIWTTFHVLALGSVQSPLCKHQSGLYICLQASKWKWYILAGGLTPLQGVNYRPRRQSKQGKETLVTK